MIVVRKPSKPDYTKLGAYHPIALINTIAKTLSACITEDVTDMAELCQLLPANHFGCCPGRTTTNSLHYVTKLTKDAWRKGEVVSTLFLDIKGMFPSVILNQLIHDMRTQGVPTQYTDWIYQKVAGRRTSITFNRHTSEPRTLSRGLDQGCPLSGITFQFYNADLIDICDKKSGEDVVAFVDDTLLLAQGKNIEITNNKVKDMMERD